MNTNTNDYDPQQYEAFYKQGQRTARRERRRRIRLRLRIRLLRERLGCFILPHDYFND